MESLVRIHPVRSQAFVDAKRTVTVDSREFYKM